MVLDTARLKFKERNILLGMRGRDVARKSTLKVNIFTCIHDRFLRDPVYRESQFAIGWTGQSAKSGTNLQKKTIHIVSLQRKREDTKDKVMLLRTKQAKLGLWNFDLITEPLTRWKIVYTTNQENQLKSLSIQVHNDEYYKDKKFSPKVLLQRPSWATHRMGVLAFIYVWSWKWAHIFHLSQISFCYSWFRLQSIAIHCNRRCVWTEHPHTRLSLAVCTFNYMRITLHGSVCGIRVLRQTSLWWIHRGHKSLIFQELSSDSSKNDIGVLSSVRNGNSETTSCCARHALLRGLQEMVCAEHARNGRVLCLTDSVSWAFAFERRRARNFKLLGQLRKLTSLCLCHQINFNVKWIASESNYSDDPSRRHDLSQHQSRDFSNNPFFRASECLNDGDEGAMLARTTECSCQLEDSSRGGAHTQHEHPLQDAETSERQQDGVLGEYLAGHERVGEGQIRCDDLRVGGQCPRLSEERRRLIGNRAVAMGIHSEKNLPF